MIIKNIIPVIAIFFIVGKMEAQKVIPLYSDSIPNSITTNNKEATHYNGDILIVEHVSRPTLTVYYPQNITNNTAVIICPGGAYAFLAAGHEGEDVAKAFNKIGITAFVLKYRIPDNSTMLNKEISPLQDVQQAMKIVRSKANEFNINPEKIGVMGFSAGGHLASTLGTHYTKSLIDNYENISLRPDFMILIYPVISFRDGITHSGSRDNLIGIHPTQEKKDYYSGELLVNKNTPPAFLIHANDDSLVSATNSTFFYEALLLHQVPSEMHIYQTGGHGFGMKKQNLPIDEWVDKLINWLYQNKYINIKPVADNDSKTKEDEQLSRDWAGLKKYEIANQSVMKLYPHKRIVFMGSSSIENWYRLDSAFFKQRSYINRGIGGQTSPQMLVRFRQDVINLKPDAVVILAGTNDIAQNTGPITHENILGNIISMVELAKANKIKVLLCSNLPVYDFPWRRGLKPAGKIKQLNSLIKEYADKNGIVYVDYFSQMADERNGMKAKLTEDGAHANLTGYKIMETIVESEILKILQKKL